MRNSAQRQYAALCLGWVLTACNPGDPTSTTVLLDLTALPAGAVSPSGLLYSDENKNRVLDEGELTHPPTSSGGWEVSETSISTLVYPSSLLGQPYVLTNSLLQPLNVSPFDTLLAKAEVLFGPTQAMSFAAHLFSKSLTSISAAGISIGDPPLFRNQQVLALWYLLQFNAATGGSALKNSPSDALLLLKLLRDKAVFDATPSSYGVEQLLNVLRISQSTVNFATDTGSTDTSAAGFPEDACRELAIAGFKCM